MSGRLVDRLRLLTAVFVAFVFARRAVCRGPCDPIVPQYCLLPFPNSFFTREDPSAETGVRVNFSSASFPTDSLGRGTNVTEWNELGG